MFSLYRNIFIEERYVGSIVDNSKIYLNKSILPVKKLRDFYHFVFIYSKFRETT